MDSHPSRDAFERYVMGADDEVERALLEAHVVGCTACAATLAHEARVELALIAAVSPPSRCPACERPCPASRCDHCGAARAVRGYRIQRVVGQTAHGRVYLAEAPDGAPVALKELVFTQVPDFAAIEAFEREGRVLRQLDHVCIPRYRDSFVEGEGVHTRFYLAQEHVPGISLDRLLEEHRFTEAEARELADQVLEILVYLQDLKPAVIHRDLKPANLIRGDDGRVVLVDFGAARERGATMGATMVGTVGYAPPEQVVGIVDSTSDPYALGMTVIELLSRAPPWTRAGLAPDIDKLEVSPSFARWLRRLTAARARDRFESARAARAALRAGGTRGRTWPILATVAAATVPGAIALWVSSRDGAGVGAPAAVEARAGVAVASGAGGAASGGGGASGGASGSSGGAAASPSPTVTSPARDVMAARAVTGTAAISGGHQPGPSPAAAAAATPTPTPVRGAARSVAPRPTPRASLAATEAQSGTTALAATSPSPTPSPGADCVTDANIPMGFLNIDTVPPSTVYWGDRRLGDTPLAKLKFPSGCIEVRVETAEGRSRKVRLKIEPNRTLRYRFDVDPPPPYVPD